MGYRINKKKMRRALIILCTWILLIVSGITYLAGTGKPKIRVVEKLVKKEVPIKTEKVDIFYPNKSNKDLEKMSEDIMVSESKRDKIQKIIEKDISVLYENKFLSTDKIQVMNVYMLNNTVYIDFNLLIKELEDDTEKNKMVLTSLARSVVQVENTEKVKFMVNGDDGKKALSRFYPVVK